MLYDYSGRDTSRTFQGVPPGTDELISHAAAHMVEGVAQLAHVEGTAVARSKAHFVFPDGPGLLCLDYDPQTLHARRRSGVAIDDQMSERARPTAGKDARVQDGRIDDL